ncbi:MAG: hypothetical protein GXO92_06535 [FCB group bacterium]|nr:hypothetical protein [FCB group bacterium]
MKFSLFLILFCFGAWGIISGLMPRYTGEIFFGMIAPLLVGVTTVLLVKRTHNKDPRKMTDFLVKALIAKMVLYGVYIVIIMVILAFDPIAFIISFAGFFILLHGLEALYFTKTFRAKQN